MNDVKKVYYDDLKEKSAIVRSARSAARLKHANLQRHYTKKEIEAMNGPSYTINLQESVTWEQFKGLPKDLQKTYLDNIFKQFKIGPSSIARMLGISNQYTGKFLRELGYAFPTRASRKDEVAFEQKYIGKSCMPAIAVPVTVESKLENIKLTTVTLTGAFSAEGIAKSLANLFTEGQTVIITVSISN